MGRLDHRRAGMAGRVARARSGHARRRPGRAGCRPMTSTARPRRILPIWRMLADSLNDYAEAIDAERLMPDMTPPYPSFWFAGLAREMRSMRGTTFLDL